MLYNNSTDVWMLLMTNLRFLVRTCNPQTRIGGLVYFFEKIVLRINVSFSFPFLLWFYLIYLSKNLYKIYMDRIVRNRSLIVEWKKYNLFRAPNKNGMYMVVLVTFYYQANSTISCLSLRVLAILSRLVTAGGWTGGQSVPSAIFRCGQRGKK